MKILASILVLGLLFCGNQVRAQQPNQPVEQSAEEITERKQFWISCVLPITQKDRALLEEVLRFPLDGDWSYMMGLDKPGSACSKADFFKHYDSLFDRTFTDNLQAQDYRDITHYQNDNNPPERAITVAISTERDGTTFESSVLLRYRLSNRGWKLYLIHSAQ